MVIRTLEEADIDKGLLDVLGNLSKVEKISNGRFGRIFTVYKKQDSPYRVWVAEEAGRIIATATLIVTWKLLRGGIKAGRISDVATHPDWEGRGIGSQLVKNLIEIAKFEGCYKVTLSCSRKNTTWYAKFGFREHEMAMRLDL